MGIKDLWSILTPYAERKPINELRGKKVAIDLAGWVCESLNVVDHFIHPKHHLKSLYFRTCYLLWENVMPVFVLDGVAPALKNQVIMKRNDVNFRGVKPKGKRTNAATNTATTGNGRTNFSRTLEQCKSLLQLMGIQCVQAPGEAEAYCAVLNKRGIVDGVISQDSDCFAYGACYVFRNFSVSMQGKVAAQGGAIDIYDAQRIYKEISFGQNKCIAMALLCGCDYCPDGVGGVGKEGVLNLFKKYDDKNILERLRAWRAEDGYYNALEMKVNDKSICTNCGHIGRTQSHTKNGCSICHTTQGCDATLWKEERDSIKAELLLRKKAMAMELFPNEQIIAEFLNEPAASPDVLLIWKRPDIIKFIPRFSSLLQWPELYCFQKFLPILTRWQLLNTNKSNTHIVVPRQILKKRTIRGNPSLEIMWQEKNCNLLQLIPAEQILRFEQENAKCREDLWITVEPFSLVEQSYYELLATFIESTAPKKTKKIGERKLPKKKNKITQYSTIDKFLSRNPVMSTPLKMQTKYDSFPSDLESDCENMDISDIVNDIVNRKVEQRLCCIPKSLLGTFMHVDDSDIITHNRKSAIADKSHIKYTSLDDSFDVLMQNGTDRLKYLNNLKCTQNHRENQNESSFFHAQSNNEDCDAFEILLNISQGGVCPNDDNMDIY